MPPTWHSKNLGDALLASAELARIQALFLAICPNADSSADLAIFIRHESEGRLHCEAVLYFPPAAAVMARAVNATLCGQPSPHDLGVLAGSREALAALFPPAL